MEYRSGVSFLGLPIVHIAMGSFVNGRYRRGVATGWIAIGDIAFGVFFALGGIAFGGISLGGVSLGFLPLGGFAMGALAIGGLAMGVVAFGGAALGWYAAIGGLAFAHDYAIGGVASAQRVIAPISPGTVPFPPISYTQYTWFFALCLFGIAGALLIFTALIIQARLRE